MMRDQMSNEPHEKDALRYQIQEQYGGAWISMRLLLRQDGKWDVTPDQFENEESARWILGLARMQSPGRHFRLVQFTKTEEVMEWPK